MQLTPKILHDTDTNEPIAPMTLASQVFREDGTTMLDALWFDAEDEEIVEDIELVKKNEIVNNLTSGGTNVPLSAEMGKKLFDTLNQVRRFKGDSDSGTSVTFYNVPIATRIPALCIGNANGVPYLVTCALASGGAGTDDCAITSGTISQSNNGDGTMNVTVGGVVPWGIYHLIVFY